MTLRRKLGILTSSLKSSQQSSFKINYTYFNKLSIVLSMLINHGYFFGTKIHNSKLVIYCKQTSKFYDLKLIVSGRIYFSFYQLQAKINKYPLSIFFVSNTFGVLDNNKILELRVGGYLLLVLKNKHVAL